MHKKTGIIFVIAGAVLIVSALLFFLYNQREDRHAQQEAELLLEEMKALPITEEAPPPPAVYETEIVTPKPDPAPDVQEVPETPQEAPAETPISGTAVSAHGGIGYLSIPDLGLELPVLAEWSYDLLKIAPCRHTGSVETDDLVIAAHNYKSHFGRLSALQISAEVTFTDPAGSAYRYVLSAMETVSPDDTDSVLNSGYDLVLYTCTTGRSNRVAAFFTRVVDE